MCEEYRPRSASEAGGENTKIVTQEFSNNEKAQHDHVALFFVSFDRIISCRTFFVHSDVIPSCPTTVCHF